METELTRVIIRLDNSDKTSENHNTIMPTHLAKNLASKIINWKSDFRTSFKDVEEFMVAEKNFHPVEKIVAPTNISDELFNKALEYVNSSQVEDSKELPAMLLGDVAQLIIILTGREITSEDLEYKPKNKNQ